ncbi:MAG: hypothetical protein ACRETL_02720 [Gammaproteobacteria bacterium]
MGLNLRRTHGQTAIAVFFTRVPNDVIAVRRDMEAIAASTRFDIYCNTTIVHVTNAIVKTHTMNLPTAFIATIGVASALAMPAYQTIVNAKLSPNPPSDWTDE